MVMSVLQDGQAPNFLDPLVFKYLTGTLEVQGITSPAHREFGEKVGAKPGLKHVLPHEQEPKALHFCFCIGIYT